MILPVAELGDSLLPTLTFMDEFQRFSQSGIIDVKTVAPKGVDLYPPAKIQDLKAEQADFNSGLVTLTWTAVGDELDSGVGKL